jgi:hypothetical protein
MGLFGKWQPVYADVGVPTFPLKGKRPAIKGYDKGKSDQRLRLAAMTAREGLGGAMRGSRGPGSADQVPLARR